MYKVTVSDTGSLIASVPALLGFVPAESFVLVSTIISPGTGDRLGVVQRCDLAPLVATPALLCAALARNLADPAVTRLVGVVVTSPAPAPATSGALPHQAAMNTVVTALQRSGFDVADLLFVPTFTAGAPWRCYLEHDHTGQLPDPATTPFATACTAVGYTTAPSRDALATWFCPAPEADRTRLSPLIEDALNLAAIDRALRSSSASARLARARQAVRAASNGELPRDDATIADLTATLATTPFQDILLAAPTPADHLGTQNLALHLWRVTPEPHASQLAIVIAAHALQDGKGAWARTALEAVGSPTSRSRLFTRVLDQGITPSQLRALVTHAAQQARQTLGVEDPAPSDAADPS